jgi:hypothetical protein
VNFVNSQLANHAVECTWIAGTRLLDDATVTVPNFDQSGVTPGFATLPLVATLTTTGGDVSQTCAYLSHEGQIDMTGWRVVATTIGAPTTLVPH